MNVGNGWTGSAFVTSVSGIYFFSCGSDVLQGTSAGLNLYVNGIVVGYLVINSLSYLIDSSTDFDFMARSWLITLTANNSVIAGLSYHISNRLTDQVDIRLYYSGFFYRPVNGLQVCYEIISYCT